MPTKWLRERTNGSKNGLGIAFEGCGVVGEVSRGEKMAPRGTDPESYITEDPSVYEDDRLSPSSFLLASLELSNTTIYEP